MHPYASASGAQTWLLYPAESRRVLGELETPAVKVEEMVYVAGLCVAPHSHDTANFIYVIAGTHWSGHSRGGDLCPPLTAPFRPQRMM
jgi:quercetin dioxygenase-like cupin family protein